MSSSAIINQTRLAVPAGTGVSFQITSIVQDPGPLPDSGLFLYQIGTALDPTTDTFARVCVITDFSQVSSAGYPVNRWNALLEGLNFYRSSSAIVTFGDINSAVAGTSALNDAINSLLNTYESYDQSFLEAAPGLTTYYPTTSPSILASAISTWQTAHSNTLTAQLKAQTAATALATAQISISSAQTLVNTLTNLNVSLITPLEQAAQTLSAQLVAANANLTSACTAIGAIPSNYPQGLAQRSGSDFFSQLVTLLYNIQYNMPTNPVSWSANVINAFNTFWPNGGAQTLVNIKDSVCASQSTPATIPSAANFTTTLQSAQNSLASSSAAYNTAAQTAAVANQNLIAAQNIENLALASVVSLCPDFDVNNPTLSS